MRSRGATADRQVIAYDPAGNLLTALRNRPDTDGISAANRSAFVNARARRFPRAWYEACSRANVMISEAHPTAIRYSLGALLAFGALNAFGGGYYGLSGASGVPTEWLEGSPFGDYFYPSLILLVVVGGSFLGAAIAVFAALRIARVVAFGAGLVVLGWLTAQLAIIGYVSWMQPTTAIAGVVVLVLGSRLPHRQ